MQSNPNRKTQCGCILARLIEAHGGEVPAPEIAKVGGLQFQTRIWELRHKLGFVIENRTERTENGQVHSFYRLVSGPVSRPFSQYCQNAKTIPTEQSLFGELRVTHKDLG
jgi:hypothetical protein